MRKIIFTLCIIMSCAPIFAQTPQGFNYQAVVRNAAGQLMSNRTVGTRITILHGSENGDAVYQQEATVNTNANGLFTLIVGDNSASFTDIKWAQGPYYIQSEIDLSGGNNYTLSTTQMILAVPYALYSKVAGVAERISDDWSYDERDPLFRNWGYLYDSLRNVPTNLSQFNNDMRFLTADDLLLTLHGDTLFINGGNYVILPINSRGTIEWDSVLNRPTHLSDFINDLDFITSETQGLNDVVAINNNAYGQIKNVHTPTAPLDAVNKAYLDSTLAAEVAALNTRIDGLSNHIDSLNNSYTYQFNNVNSRIDSLDNSYTYQFNNVNTRIDSLNNSYTYQFNNVNSRIDNLNNRIDSLNSHLDIINNNYTYYLDSVNNRVDSLTRSLDSLNNYYTYYFDSVNSRIHQLEHPYINGALPGIFSVSTDTKVNFSQGNLQYRPRIKTWRFAVTQYDIAGNANNNVYLQNYCSDWIDLFGYGTSGWDGGASRFMPYETTTNNTEYTEDPNGNDLTNFYANADWGFYNSIINGGNQSALWRTLTSTEWTYILTLRPNAILLKGMATVENTPGYIILPDNWTCPAGLTFVNSNASYTDNVYNAANWAIMEAAGAVFLPAAGQRIGGNTSSIGIIGDYWTASHVNGTSGYTFHIAPNANQMQNDVSFSTGCSVRLVHEY